MSEKQVTSLTQLYNTLLLISTRGEDTMIMAECIKALQQIIQEGAQEAGLTVQAQNKAAPEHVDAEVVEE